MRTPLKNLLCGVLAFLMVVEPTMLLQRWAPKPQAAAQELPAKKEDATKKAVPAKLSPADLKRIADELERGFKALEAAAKEIARDTFDPKAIVDKVGKDPVKLFEWVRDNTYWVPYQGALRGPTGVLMDRLGSSLDRSLLLAELLLIAGHKARLARAELPEDQAKALLPKLRPVPKEPLPKPAAATKKETEALIQKYAKEYKLDAPAIQKDLETVSLQAATLAEDVAQRVAAQTPLILKAVGKPDETTAKSEREREAAAQLQALRDHWWVQRQDDKGWTDLDPLLAEAQTGSSQATPKATFPADAKTGKIALDGKFCHEVQISVVIEQWSKDGLAEKQVLSHTLRPFEIFGERIALRHIPMHWPKDLSLFNEKDPLKKLKATVLAENEWLPVLTLGSKLFTASSFTDSGDTNKAGASQFASGLEAGIKAFDPFKKFSPPDPKPKPPQSKLTAEWIDYQIASPGQPIRKIRRQIFDLLGPAARATKKTAEPKIEEMQRLERGCSLMGETEFLSLVCHLSPEFMQFLSTTSASANREVLLNLVSHASPSQSGKELIDIAARASPWSARLYALAVARRQWSRATSNVYLDCINVLAFRTHIRPNLRGDLLLCNSFDIVANRVAVHPGADAFVARVEQGIVDTNAEAFLLRGCGTVRNTAELFASFPGGFLTLRDADNQAWKEAELGKDVRTRIQQDLSNGFVVLTPTKSMLLDGHEVIGWWRVHPVTGETLGIGADGSGQTATENALIQSIASLPIVLATTLICYAIASSGTGTGNLPANHPKNIGHLRTCLATGVAAGAGIVAGGGLVAVVGTAPAVGLRGIIAALLAGVAQGVDRGHP